MGVSAGVAGAGMAAYGAYTQAQGAKAQAGFTAAQYLENQKLAKLNANQAYEIGSKNAGLQVQQTKAQVGQQRAAAAASGTDVNSGSNEALQQDTQNLGAINEMTIRNNATREALGYQITASSLNGQSAMALLAGQNQSNNTLLTGGMNAASFGTKAYGSWASNYGSTGSVNVGGNSYGPSSNTTAAALGEYNYSGETAPSGWESSLGTYSYGSKD